MTLSKTERIMTVGYYADFSRFFKSLEIQLKSHNKHLEFIHVNYYLSGHLYSLFHNQRSIFLPLAAKINRKYNSAVRDDEFYKQFIGYHHRLMNGVIDEELIEQSKLYYHYLEGKIKDLKPDVIVLSGDARLPTEIIVSIAKSLSIKTLYFEQAPLGHTIIDSEGVNANCSFRRPFINDLGSVSLPDYAKVSDVNWKGYKKYRLIDLIIERFFGFLMPADHIRPKRKRVDSKILDLVKAKCAPSSQAFTYLLVLQVPDDVNMIYHSPWFTNHYDIVKAVSANLPEHSRLVVREHPLYAGLYEPELYALVADHPHVYFDQSATLAQAIDESNAVIVNNSTVGLEALEKGKKLLVLGDAYYDKQGLCIKYDGKDLRKVLLATQEFEMDKSDLKKYLNYLFGKVFVPGHFRHKNSVAPKNIADRISQDDF